MGLFKEFGPKRGGRVTPVPPLNPRMLEGAYLKYNQMNNGAAVFSPTVFDNGPTLTHHWIYVSLRRDFPSLFLR